MVTSLMGSIRQRGRLVGTYTGTARAGLGEVNHGRSQAALQTSRGPTGPGGSLPGALDWTGPPLAVYPG